MNMKKIGLFLGGVLLKEYTLNPENYIQAASDLLEATKETYAFHELKNFESE